MKKALAAGVFAAILSAASLATAQPNSPANGGNIIGHWTILLNINEEPQPVFISIDSLKLSATPAIAMIIKFTGSRNCHLKAVYSGYLGGWHYFNVNTYENGGWCSSTFSNHNKLIYRFQLLPSGNLRYELKSDGKVIETAVAEPDQNLGQ
jgi:hypothetical protein